MVLQNKPIKSDMKC